MAEPTDKYPLTGFHFKVEFELNPKKDIDLMFQEVNGLSVNFEMEEHEEGGQNRFKHQLPLRASYTDIVLKRGMFAAPSTVIDWCLNAFENFEFQPCNLLISLLNDQHIPTESWYVINAIPKSLEFSDLNASENQLVIETLTLSYNYFNILNQRKT